MIVLTSDNKPTDARPKNSRGVEIINEVYIACLVISTIYMAMGLFEGLLLSFEGILFGALGIVLLKETSRAAAVLLISIGLISLCNGLVSWMGIVDMGDRNLLLAIFAMWCGFKAWRGTILLKGQPTIQDALNRMLP